MKASKLRDLTVEQLREEGRSLAEQLFKLRFQQATGQLEKGSKMREVRKDIARVKTLLTEKQAGSAN